MEITVTRRVNEIPANEKHALEGMLGASLDAEQQIFILAYTPGGVPSDESRANARHGIEQVLSETQAYAKERGVTLADADDAVAEAMSSAPVRISSQVD